MSRRLQRWIGVAIMVVLASWSLAAQDQATEFVPVSPQELDQEQIPAARLVFAAYAFVWATLAVYVLLLWQRMRRLEVDLKQVKTQQGQSQRAAG